MTKTVKSMLEEANREVERVDHATALRMMEEGALVLDVRDAPEVAASGKVPGAHHVSRGMLEFRADPESPYHDQTFRKDRPVLLYCASGGRSALAGKVLKEMGYAEVYNIGGFKDWTEAGGEVDRPADATQG